MSRSLYAVADREERKKVTVYLSDEETVGLEALATLQQHVLAQAFRNTLPVPDIPKDVREWYYSRAGREKFDELRITRSYTTEAYAVAFEIWRAEQEAPGASTGPLRNRFPLSHCMGLIIGRVLTVYQEALRETLEHEFAITQTKDT